MVFSSPRLGHLLHQMCFTGGRVRRPVAVVVFALALAGAAARGQSVAEPTPQKGGSEIQVWTGAGHSALNGVGATGVWNAGLRYGWILTNARGPGFLRASGTGIGANVGHGKAHWSLEVRWLHISDAGLTDGNPGINVIQVRAGLGWFHRKE